MQDTALHAPINLPDELVLSILYRLDLLSLANAEAVCTQWQRVAHTAWQQLAQRCFNLPKKPINGKELFISLAKRLHTLRAKKQWQHNALFVRPFTKGFYVAYNDRSGYHKWQKITLTKKTLKMLTHQGKQFVIPTSERFYCLHNSWTSSIQDLSFCDVEKQLIGKISIEGKRLLNTQASPDGKRLLLLFHAYLTSPPPPTSKQYGIEARIWCSEKPNRDFHLDTFSQSKVLMRQVSSSHAVLFHTVEAELWLRVWPLDTCCTTRVPVTAGTSLPQTNTMLLQNDQLFLGGGVDKPLQIYPLDALPNKLTTHDALWPIKQLPNTIASWMPGEKEGTLRIWRNHTELIAKAHLPSMQPVDFLYDRGMLLVGTMKGKMLCLNTINNSLKPRRPIDLNSQDDEQEFTSFRLINDSLAVITKHGRDRQTAIEYQLSFSDNATS